MNTQAPHGITESGDGHDYASRIELWEKINALGIGAQGLGGLTTVLDVKIRTFPVHAASLPVGLIPQCAADRLPGPIGEDLRRREMRRVVGGQTLSGFGLLVLGLVNLGTSISQFTQKRCSRVCGRRRTLSR